MAIRLNKGIPQFGKLLNKPVSYMTQIDDSDLEASITRIPKCVDGTIRKYSKNCAHKENSKF